MHDGIFCTSIFRFICWICFFILFIQIILCSLDSSIWSLANISSYELKRKSLDEFYFEEYKYDYLRQQPEYKEIANQIKYLKEEYPRVTNLVEDGDIEVLNLEELQKLQELLQLRAKEDFIEQKEVFRLGMKEMFCNLKEMNIIHLTEK